jgi:hypothetical protein
LADHETVILVVPAAEAETLAGIAGSVYVDEADERVLVFP